MIVLSVVFIGGPIDGELAWVACDGTPLTVVEPGRSIEVDACVSHEPDGTSVVVLDRSQEAKPETHAKLLYLSTGTMLDNLYHRYVYSGRAEGATFVAEKE